MALVWWPLLAALACGGVCGSMCRFGVPRDVSGRLWEPLTPMTPEFASVAQAQFEALGVRLRASRAAIFFRRENPRTGSLEFVAAAVWPATQRVWIVGEGVLASVDSPSLPGGTDAGELLPTYPFLTRAASTLPESGLSVPLVHGSTVLGVLAVWRAAARPASDEVARVDGGADGSLRPAFAKSADDAEQGEADDASAGSRIGTQATRSTPHPGASGPLDGWSASELQELEVCAQTLAVAALFDRRYTGGVGYAAAAAAAEAANSYASSARNGASHREASRQIGARGMAGDSDVSADSRSRAVLRTPCSPEVDERNGKRQGSLKGEYAPRRKQGDDRRERAVSGLELAELRQLLASSVHQLRSPVAATRTLCKLLLRRVPLSDSVSRALLRDILLQAERTEDLLVPLDALAKAKLLPVANEGLGLLRAAADLFLDQSNTTSDASPSTEEEHSKTAAPAHQVESSPLPLIDVKTSPSKASTNSIFSGDSAAAAATVDPTRHVTVPVCFVSDVLSEIGSVGAALAVSNGQLLFASCDEDSPGVRASERALREVLTNLLDNAMKYATPVVSEVHPNGDIVQSGKDRATRGDGNAKLDLKEPSVGAEAVSPNASAAPDSAPKGASTSRSAWAAAQRTRLSGRPCVTIDCAWVEEQSRVCARVWNSFHWRMEESEFKRAFEWGYRGDRAATVPGGLKGERGHGGDARREDSLVVEGEGIGLHYAHELIARMGGTLELLNEPMPEWAAQRRAALLGLPLSAGDVSIIDPTRPWGISAVIRLPRAMSSALPADGASERRIV